MARSDTRMLEKGDFFPSLVFETLDNGSISFPNDLNGKFCVFLFYRGYW